MEKTKGESYGTSTVSESVTEMRIVLPMVAAAGHRFEGGFIEAHDTAGKGHKAVFERTSPRELFSKFPAIYGDGVECDNCGAVVVKESATPVYKCEHCADFDLCEICVASGAKNVTLVLIMAEPPPRFVLKVRERRRRAWDPHVRLMND